MSLYRVTYDGEDHYVEAPSMPEALKVLGTWGAFTMLADQIHDGDVLRAQPDPDARALAERIAEDLMTAAGDERGDRLVLWSDRQDRNLGGWAFGPLVARIERILKGAQS